MHWMVLSSNFENEESGLLKSEQINCALLMLNHNFDNWIFNFVFYKKTYPVLDGSKITVTIN